MMEYYEFHRYIPKKDRRQMRKRIYEIIEVANDDDKLSALYDMFMMIVICASIIPLCFKEQNSYLNVIDKVTV